MLILLMFVIEVRGLGDCIIGFSCGLRVKVNSNHGVNRGDGLTPSLLAPYHVWSG